MVTLSEAQMPNHTHPLTASEEAGDRRDPANLWIGAEAMNFRSPSDLGDMLPQSLPDTGGSQPHNNLQPFLTMNYIIALVGLYPSRS